MRRVPRLDNLRALCIALAAITGCTRVVGGSDASPDTDRSPDGLHALDEREQPDRLDASANDTRESSLDATPDLTPLDAGPPPPDVLTCALPAIVCAARCIDPASDSLHCGACDTPCAAGTHCELARCVRPAARLIAPLSTATVTSRTPTLRWVLAGGATGARVELCRDRACTRPLAALTGTTTVTPPTELARGPVFWRAFARRGDVEEPAPTPTWQFYVGARTAPVDTSFGTTLDLNGDGLPEIAIGDLYATVAGRAEAGHVMIFRGDRAGLPAAPTQVLGGTARSQRFGNSVAGAGDVNGDGFADLLVSSWFAEIGGLRNVGQVWCFLGDPSGVADGPAWTVSGSGEDDGFGVFVASAGDVNGDGFADVLASGRGPAAASPRLLHAELYLGGPSGLSPTSARTLFAAPAVTAMGLSIAGAGDVNGDGFADVVTGTFLPVDAPGAMYLYTGSAAGLATVPQTITRADAGFAFGRSVACAGDVNGDGLSDVLTVSARAPDEYLGVVSVYAGTRGGGLAATPFHTFEDRPADRFGFSIASAGDVNADGYGDVVIGASAASPSLLRSWTGEARTYLGSADGAAAWTSFSQFGTGGEEHLGWHVAGAGDVNGDGFADVVATAPGGGLPYALVLAGSAAGVDAMPRWRFVDSGGFGYALAGSW